MITIAVRVPAALAARARELADWLTQEQVAAGGVVVVSRSDVYRLVFELGLDALERRLEPASTEEDSDAAQGPAPDGPLGG